jgi:hypothetical protein
VVVSSTLDNSQVSLPVRGPFSNVGLSLESTVSRRGIIDFGTIASEFYQRDSSSITSVSHGGEESVVVVSPSFAGPLWFIANEKALQERRYLVGMRLSYVVV